jgi:FtsP/CotA-like multicopper oxidase with cupredoxin domain
MYGAFVVLPKGEADSFEFLKNDNHYLVFLDDTDIRRWDTDALDEGEVESTLMGSYGSRMFINGDLSNPFDLGEHALNDEIFVTFINSANVRPYNLKVDGLEMVKIAGDASGFQNQDQISNLVIGPSERYTVRFDLDNTGNFEIVSTGGNKDYKIATVKVANTLTANEDSILSELEIDTQLLSSFYEQKVDKNIELTMNMDDSLMGGMMTGMPCHQMPDGSWMGDCEDVEHTVTGDGIEWEDEMPMMNLMSDLSNVEWQIVDLDTGKSGMDIDWTFSQGNYIKISVTNNESSMHPMQHPFHIHGQRFLVLTEDGTQNDNLAWKDTVMIPAGETYELIVEISNPGEWVAHCHIPEHMEAGMMMKFNVI